jgi:hypothetical protein
MTPSDERKGKRVRSLRELPQSIEPRRDLWPAIDAAIGVPAGRTGVEPRRRTGRVPHFLALAATVAALAVGVWIGRITLPIGPAAPGDAITANGGTTMPVGYVNDPVYRQERARLVRSLESQLASLSPETRKQVTASLETIRQSMKDLEAALGRDPSNALLQGLLVNTYQEEMRVMAAVGRASTEEI